MTPRKPLLIALAAAAAAAVPAIAATPESGTVSNASPKVEWSGEAPGYGVGLINVLGSPTGPVCEAPACDTFELTVADVNDLTISGDSTTGSGPGCDCPQLFVTRPDGSQDYVSAEADQKAVIKIRNAPKGVYTVGFSTNEQPQNDASYTASAVLAAPPPPPSEEPAPGASPTPAPQGQQPAPAASPQITIRTRSGSARRAKKGLKVGLTTNQELTKIVAQLRKGKKVVAKGALAKLNGNGTILVKAKKLKKGKYTLVVTGNGPNGSKAGASVPFTVKK
jgi:hypothetical protein